MKKFIIFIFFVLVTGVGLYFVSGVILEMATDRAVDYIVRNFKIHNIEYTRPLIRYVNFSSYDAVKWEDISFNARMVRNEVAGMPEEFSLKIGSMTITLESLFDSVFILHLEGVSVSANAKGSGSLSDISGAGDRMERGNLKVWIRLRNFSKPVVIQQVRDLIREINAFATGGATKIPISFLATELFEIKGKPIK